MPPLKGSDLDQAHADTSARKAAGPEGWRPEELWDWPAPALELLANFLNKIEQGHSWPRALMQWRQVHLSKPNKPAGEFGGLRPISMFIECGQPQEFASSALVAELAREVYSALLEPLAELEVAQRSHQEISGMLAPQTFPKPSTSCTAPCLSGP